MATPLWFAQFLIELEKRMVKEAFENMKMTAKSFGFKSGELERMKRLTDLLQNMQRRNLLGPDNFGPLKAMVKGCGADMNLVLKYIEEVEAKHSPKGAAVDHREEGEEVAGFAPGLSRKRTRGQEDQHRQEGRRGAKERAMGPTEDQPSPPARRHPAPPTTDPESKPVDRRTKMAQNPEREKDFKNLVHLTIMDSLTEGQYDRIKKIFTGPKPKQIKKGVAENLKKIDFPDKLMGLGLLSETDLGKLKEALIDIDECDLLNLINEYEVKYGLAAGGGGGGGGSSGNATAGLTPGDVQQ